MKRITLALIFPLRYYAHLTASEVSIVPAASLRAPEPRESRRRHNAPCHTLPPHVIRWER
jgi:hypothetical protein